MLRIGVNDVGLADLAAACKLTKEAVSVEMFEADSTYLGSISRTVEIESIWNEILPEELITRQQAFITHLLQKEILQLPLRGS